MKSRLMLAVMAAVVCAVVAPFDVARATKDQRMTDFSTPYLAPGLSSHFSQGVSSSFGPVSLTGRLSGGGGRSW